MFCVNDDVNDNVELMVKIMSKSYQITTPHSFDRLKEHSHAVDLVLLMITSDKPLHRSLVITRRHWNGIWRIRRRRRCVLISGLILMNVPKSSLFVVNKNNSFHHLLLKILSSVPICFFTINHILSKQEYLILAKMEGCFKRAPICGIPNFKKGPFSENRKYPL